MTPQFEENLLRHVLGLGSVSKVVVGEREHQILVLSHDPLVLLEHPAH